MFFKRFMIIFCLFFCMSFLSATKVKLIPYEPFSTPEDNNNLSFYLMDSIMKKLNIDFVYEYITLADAMQLIDEEADVLIFPYIRPRNMSNRILISDTLYTATHKVFYDKRLHDYLEIHSLSDLRTYIIGSHAQYPYEIELRRAGLTIHYSNDNFESFQKLLDQSVAFVLEERIAAMNILKNLDDVNKQFIDFYEVDLFPQPFYVATSIFNESTKLVILSINELLQDKEFVDNLIKGFFDDKYNIPTPQ